MVDSGTVLMGGTKLCKKISSILAATLSVEELQRFVIFPGKQDVSILRKVMAQVAERGLVVDVIYSVQAS